MCHIHSIQHYKVSNTEVVLDECKSCGLCLQIRDFISSLVKYGRYHVLTDDQIMVILSISQDLSAALEPSDEVKRPIPPQDLITTAILLDAVAE